MHYATYEALILGFANARNLKDIRRGLKERSEGARKPTGPRPKRLTGPKFESKLGAYCLPFLGSGEHSNRSQIWSPITDHRSIH